MFNVNPLLRKKEKVDNVNDREANIFIILSSTWVHSVTAVGGNPIKEMCLLEKKRN